ncbi:E3 ubiquitin/ISG15 ligase TRIM25-like, partial [Dendropsophus ebraccatus]|uniref:E3 ubiquitin/ISG15 ligase TRIM25-like n=1 Tax=Dendropsophus ebraccatus TaxID=150705 RepID=UPI00383227A1
MATCKPGEDLICHICQNPYSDPVSLPCGHSFCLDCIREYLNTQDQSQFYTCPQCGKRFTARPSLQRNPKLSQHVEHLQSAREKPQVLCTYCINPSTPAIKTCLRCEVSLCSAHLAAHNRRLEHNLRNATKSLESQKCPDHNLPLKYYCPQDSACVCADCGLLGGHKGHKVESLYKASKTKKEELKTNLHRLDSKRMETETTIQSLQKSLSVEREKAKNLEEQVIATFRHLKEQLQDLEKTVLAEVSMQENKVSEYYSNLILELKKKEKKQSQNISDIKKLLRFTSPITFLQQSGAVEGATCKEEEEKGEESKEVPLIKELDPDLILGNVYRSLTAILTYNVPKGGTYKGMKEEGTSGKSLYTETKLEVDSVLDSKEPGDTFDELNEFTTIATVFFQVELESPHGYRM